MPVPYARIEGRAVADARSGYGKDGTPWVIVNVACSDVRKCDDGSWENVRTIFIDVSWWNADDRIYIPQKGDKVTAAGKLYVEDEEYQGKTYRKVKLMADFIKAFERRDHTQQSQSGGGVWNAPAAQPGGDEEPPF